MNRLAAAVLLVSLVTACAPARAARPGGNARTITTEEIRNAGQSDAWLLVQMLRPHWLSTRGTSTLHGHEEIKVYLDASLLGGPATLRQVNTSSISLLRFLDGLEASQRWGLDHGNGAIVISSRPTDTGA